MVGGVLLSVLTLATLNTRQVDRVGEQHHQVVRLGEQIEVEQENGGQEYLAIDHRYQQY